MGEESEFQPGKVLSRNASKEVQLGASRQSRTRVHHRMKITETKNGAIIEVYVRPQSQKFEVQLEGDEVVVRCTEEPVKGKVNKELLNGLSKFFGTDVELVSGATSRQKRLLLKGMTKNEAQRILRNETSRNAL